MLTERRKADRIKMCELLVSAVEQSGGTATVQPHYTGETGDFIVKIVPVGGARLNVDFERRSCQPDVFVLSWHMDHDSDDRFDPAYWGRDAVNLHHYGKATRVAHGIDELLALVREDVMACRDGDAYSEAIKAQQIAKHGTAAARNARYAEWRAELAHAA